MNTDIIICPVCQNRLEVHNTALKCALEHSFDLSAKGYINLLTDKYKNSLLPGDNKEMVLARRRFLQSGAFSPLQNGLADAIKNLSDTLVNVIDAGCGEGTYASFISEQLPENVSMYGFDISKDAIIHAAKKSRHVSWIVASLFHLPVQTHSIDCILNVFAPASNEEFDRVLAKDGKLITAIPGKKHLWELKKVLYDEPYENDETFPPLPSFTLVSKMKISGQIHINNQADLHDLLAMTPYFWRTPKNGIEKAKLLNELDSPIEFIIGTFVKNNK